MRMCGRKDRSLRTTCDRTFHQFAAIRAFAPMLKASGDGLIVSVSSIAGQTGVGSSIAYCAAKAGIDVMTKSLARALAPDIRVLAVAPGVVDTGFVPGRGADFNAKIAASTPLGRIGSAQDVAAAILACATSLQFSTGTTIVVDGGRSLWGPRCASPLPASSSPSPSPAT
jgi:3-oxoacyl-[acyl-carrier protein] reductase